MEFKRAAGTLVHPTSLPSAYGMGDLGEGARRMVDFLAETGQRLWQILPLTPPGNGHSPYAAYSAFASNPYLISPDLLFEKGLVDAGDLDEGRVPESTWIDYDAVCAYKERLFRKASGRFYAGGDSGTHDGEPGAYERYRAFCSEHEYWLADYALFMACLEHFDYRPWTEWDAPLRRREPDAVERYRRKLDEAVRRHRWLQFEFQEQWKRLRRYAHENGIRIIGDLPIFVDHNSCDVWAGQHNFELDREGARQWVAGVPPDYFSETGQLWGNPLYRWDRMEADGYAWWINRFRHMFDAVDAVRVDHFRGFDAYWRVRAEEETAMNGEWVDGPGKKLFDRLQQELGKLAIIAEDLGLITERVRKLRRACGFPGMKVLQFAFGGDPANDFLPHNYTSSNAVVYTGTHDNNTSLGWYEAAPEVERHHVREYMQCDGSRIHWDMIRLAMLSVAGQAVIPLQDYMGLDARHRMNVPGTVEGNWRWRFTTEMLERVDRAHIRHLIELSNRLLATGEEDVTRQASA